jgi:hypothetical protein
MTVDRSGSSVISIYVQMTGVIIDVGSTLGIRSVCVFVTLHVSSYLSVVLKFWEEKVYILISFSPSA